MRQVEAPFGGLPLIVSFGPTLHVSGLRGVGGGSFRSFVAGLQESWVLHRAAGRVRRRADQPDAARRVSALRSADGRAREPHRRRSKTCSVPKAVGSASGSARPRPGTRASRSSAAALRERLARATPRLAGDRVGLAAAPGIRRARPGSARSPRPSAVAASTWSPSSASRSDSRPRLSRGSCASSGPRRLLRRPEATPLDVALACGYFDQSAPVPRIPRARGHDSGRAGAQVTFVQSAPCWRR